MRHRYSNAGYIQLQRLSKEGGSLAQISGALELFGDMYIVEDPEQTLPPEIAEAQEKMLGSFQTELAAPPVCNVTRDNKRMPLVFTSEHLAQLLHGTNGHSPQDVRIQRAKWASGLYSFLVQGYDGVIIDADNEHSITLDRAQIACIFGLLDSDNFLSKTVLGSIVKDGEILIHEMGEHKIAYLYETSLAAQAGIKWFKDHIGDEVTGAQAEDRVTAEALKEIISNGASMAFVNAGLADQRPYYREDLVRLLFRRGIILNIKTEEAKKAAEEQDTFKHLREQAERTKTLPVFKSDELTDEQTNNVFCRLRKKAEDRMLEPWQFLEDLAFRLSFHIPPLPKSKAGLIWPTFWRSESNSFTVTCFTREADLRKEYGLDSTDDADFVRISGIEAFRWILATPAPFDEISFDDGNSSNWMHIPGWWGLVPLFPLLNDTLSKDEIPEVPASEVFGLAGARSLKPEIAKFLLENAWKFVPDAQPAPGRWVTYSYDPGKAKSADDNVFEAMLDKAKLKTGVILHINNTKLPINKSQLAIFQAWQNHGDINAPHDDLITQAGSLLKQGKISNLDAATLAAEIPRHWLLKTPDNNFLKLPDKDAYLFFSSEEKAKEYLDSLKQEEDTKEILELNPIVSGYETSAFHLSYLEGQDICINPLVEGGLYLDKEAIEEALSYLDKKLKPRVPCFLDPNFKKEEKKEKAS